MTDYRVSDDEQFQTYQAVNCASDTQCPIELNARFGPSALATVAPREFIKSIEQFPEVGYHLLGLLN